MSCENGLTVSSVGCYALTNVRASAFCGLLHYDCRMCRNIKTLYNFDPPATSDEVNASATQFVRKLSGFNKPSKANEEVFYLAIERVAVAAQEMLNSMVTAAPPRDRETETERAKARAPMRFGPQF